MTDIKDLHEHLIPNSILAMDMKGDLYHINIISNTFEKYKNLCELEKELQRKICLEMYKIIRNSRRRCKLEE